MRNPFARRAAPPARVEPRMTTAPAERRDAGSFGLGTAFVGGMDVGDSVSSHIAENAAAVVACINAVSSAIATLPIRAYRVTSAGRVELTDHWLPRLLANPCPRCTWPELAEELLASALLHGNGLATISYDRDGQPVELHPVPWQCATPVLLESGRLAFSVSLAFGPFAGPGVFRRWLASECLYLKDRSDNGGWTGRSRLSRSPAVISAALGIQTFSAAVWRNAASPSGVITHPGRINAEGKTWLATEFDRKYSGAENARKTVILDEGMGWVSTSVSPEDAETLESRKFSVPEICRIFQVPPAIVQSLENNAFSSAEQANKWFAQVSLAPWCRKLEAAIGKALLADEPDLHVEIDMTGLTRGDFSARWASYATALQNRILTVAEVRDAEGYGPMPMAGEVVPGADP